VAKHVLGPLADFPIGTQKAVDVDGLRIAVFSTDQGLYALLDRCPHQGASLCGGAVVGWLEARRAGEYSYDPTRPLVRCPWHGWEYELATGQSWADPATRRVRPYPIAVESGAEVLEARAPGEYVAETFAVEVDGQYVVLDLARRAR
jgi:3-phenylpropionate/trans-cinnamate dioxygenase ferredoxin subunit